MLARTYRGGLRRDTILVVALTSSPIIHVANTAINFRGLTMLSRVSEKTKHNTPPKDNMAGFFQNDKKFIQAPPNPNP
jgi:hypothetical protein